MTHSPVLAIFDPDKPTLLRNDWSAEGMGCILMYPTDDEESHLAVKLLRETGERLFDMNTNVARLKNSAFGS